MQEDSSKKMKNFYDAYLEKIDNHLVKNEIKNIINGIESDKTIINQAILQNTKELLNQIFDIEKENISKILKNFGYDDETIKALSDKKVDFLTIDNIIDKHIIKKFKQVKVPYKCEQAKHRFINTIIDIQNIKNILRAKQLGYEKTYYDKLFLGDGQEIAYWKFKEMTETEDVSQVISCLEGTSYYTLLKDNIENYTKEKSVQVLEKALDCHFLKLVSDISTKNYSSIGPSIRFLVSKEFEIMNLKIIAKGIAENLDSDMFKDLLVMEISK
jgi:V/A-type H+-transporting ATPase subunit C